MDTLLHDVRFATRQFFRTPAFSAVAVLTLALAIGATTALFSIVDTVLLQPLPYPDPGQLARVGSLRAQGPTAGTVSSMSFANFMDIRAESRSFSRLAAINITTRNLTAPDADPVQLRGARVSANWFQLLGVPPISGRAFLADDEAVGAAPVALLSQRIWRSRFGADSSIVGRTISLDNRVVTVVGISPASVNYPSAVDVWLPLSPEPWELEPGNRGANYLSAVGRLAPGVTAEAATVELGQIAARLEAEYPESNTGVSVVARPLHEFIVGSVSTTLYVMLGAVGFVLLIACANVANLLLVRAAGRETEMAVRAALGAGRGRIIRQLVTESILLAVVGGALGLALAVWIVDAVVALAPQGLPRLDEIAVDMRVLGFAAGITMLTGVLFGLAPAIEAARPQLAQMLREGARGASGRRGAHRTRRLLVGSEMALAMVLLIGAALLIRSFVELVNVDPGFEPAGVISFDISLPDEQYPYDSEMRAFSHTVLERLRAVPGVEAAAINFGRPLTTPRFRTIVDEVGQPERPPNDRHLVEVRPASQDFFRVMGMPIVAGRGFNEDDRAGREPVVVVNEEFARRYYPAESPIEKRIVLGWGRDTAASAGPDDDNSVAAGGVIVGVVSDVRQFGLDAEPFPITYLLYEQHPIGAFSILLRTTVEPRMVIAQLRGAMSEVDPKLPLTGITTMEQALSDSVSQPRFYMILLASFAGVALLLAAIGVYGVISYAVSLRTREIGVRIALGATQQSVVRLVVREGMWMTVGGVVAGMIAALWLTRFIAALLYGVPALDPITFVAVAVVLLAVAALASWIPARRAAGVDPVVAIRAD